MSEVLDTARRMTQAAKKIQDDANALGMGSAKGTPRICPLFMAGAKTGILRADAGSMQCLEGQCALWKVEQRYVHPAGGGEYPEDASHCGLVKE